MPSITFREATPGDLAALLRLLDQMDESMYRGRAVADEGELRALYEAILASAPQAQPFVGPDQEALQAMLAQMTG